MIQTDSPDDFSFSNLDVVSVGKSARSLPDLVAEQLIKAIEQGSLPQGQRLKEERLAERFGVSRSTIREAIAVLERKGIVDRTPRQGAKVVTISANEIEEIFLLRAQLIGLAAHLFALKASADQIQDFCTHAQKIQRLAEDRETSPMDYAGASIAAQNMLIDFAHQKRLRNIYEELGNAALWQSVIRRKAISFATQERRQESASDWKLVASAVSERSPKHAEERAKTLLMNSYRAVRSNINSEN